MAGKKEDARKLQGTEVANRHSRFGSRGQSDEINRGDQFGQIASLVGSDKARVHQVGIRNGFPVMSGRGIDAIETTVRS